MKHLPTVALLLLAVGLGAATLLVDPSPAAELSQLRSVGWSLAVTALAVGAVTGAGAAVLSRTHALASLDEGEAPVGWLVASVLGLLFWGLGSLALGAAGLLTPVALAIPPVLLGLGWLTRPGLRRPSPTPAVAAIAAVVGVVGLIDASAPPIDTDELYQHLALPTRMLRQGGLVGGVFHADGSRPLLLQLPFAALLSWAGDTAPRLLTVGSALGVLLGVDALSRRLAPRRPRLAAALAAITLATSWSFLHDVGLAANNLPTALAVLAALSSALAGAPIALALSAGAALSFKYTAAGAIVGIWLVARLPIRTRVWAGLLALACVTPWWARNAIDGLHPLFPYAGWDQLSTGAPPGSLQFQYLEKYGTGRSLADFVWLPWNAVMTAEIGSFRFLGRISPLPLLLAIPAAVGAWQHRGVRAPLAVGLVGALAWSAGPHWLRHMLPVLPVLAVGLSSGAVGCMRPEALLGATTLVSLAAAPANLAPMLTHLADRLPAALGQESRADYLHRAVRSAPAITWANEHLPADAKVALLYDWSTHLLERDSVLGSVEDHVPTRYWLLVHGDDSLDALAEQGVTHLVVGRFRFLRKWYPFLQDDVFNEVFKDPTDLLDRRLLRDATLIYEAGHTRIYRLDPAHESP